MELRLPRLLRLQTLARVLEVLVGLVGAPPQRVALALQGARPVERRLVLRLDAHLLPGDGDDLGPQHLELLQGRLLVLLAPRETLRGPARLSLRRVQRLVVRVFVRVEQDAVRVQDPPGQAASRPGRAGPRAPFSYIAATRRASNARAAASA